MIGRRAVHPNIFNIARKLVKVSHAAREMRTVFSMTFFLSNRPVVGPMVKMPPPPMEDYFYCNNKFYGDSNAIDQPCP